MSNTYIDFIKVIKKDLQVRIKKYDMLDRYNTLPYNFKLKLGCDSLLQNVILRELMNMLGTVITDLDIEIKMKISRIEYLENKNTPV